MKNSIKNNFAKLSPSAKKVIIQKLTEENSASAGCQFFCNGHNLPKHNKKF